MTRSKKIYILLLLALMLLPYMVIASCPKYTQKQEEAIKLAYSVWKEYDLGYTLASIVIQESFVGPYIVKVNPRDGKYGSYGITHINLETAMWLEDVKSPWEAKQDLIPLLLTNDKVALQIAVSKLLLTEGEPWRTRWAKYNGRGPKAVEYSTKIARHVRKLMTCFTLEGVDK